MPYTINLVGKLPPPYMDVQDAPAKWAYFWSDGVEPEDDEEESEDKQ